MNSFHPKVSICKPQGDGDGRDLDDTTGHGRHAGSVAVVGLFHVAARLQRACGIYWEASCLGLLDKMRSPCDVSVLDVTASALHYGVL